MKRDRRSLVWAGVCVGAIVVAALVFAPFPKPLRFTVHIPPAPQAGR